MANTIMLHTLLKHCRSNLQPFQVVSLDLKKAFDSVSHHAIIRALKQFQVDDVTVDY